jgi:hypothetical protein
MKTVGLKCTYNKVRCAAAKIINDARTIGYVEIPREEFFEVYKQIAYKIEDYDTIEGIQNKADFTSTLKLIGKKEDIPDVEDLEITATPSKYCFKFKPFSKTVDIEANIEANKFDMTWAKKEELVGIGELRPFTVLALNQERGWDRAIRVFGKNEKDIEVTFWAKDRSDLNGDGLFFKMYEENTPLPVNMLINFRLTRTGRNIRCVEAKNNQKEIGN